MTAPVRLDPAGGKPLAPESTPAAAEPDGAAAVATHLLPASPLLAGVTPPTRPLRRQRAIVTGAMLATALLTAAVWQRWFATGGLFRFVYAIHDDVVLPVIGALWTARFPWALFYVVPVAAMLALTIAGLLSGRRPASVLQRFVILATARRESGQDVLRRVHRWQCAHGLPSGFMRAVIAAAAARAVDAILLAGMPAESGARGRKGGDRALRRDSLRRDSLHRDALRRAWRLVALHGELAADAPRESGASYAEAAYAAAAQVALLWLVAPPADERTRQRLPALWQGPRREVLDRQAGRLREALGGIEAGIQEIEHRSSRFGRIDPAATPFSDNPWHYYAETIITAVFLAGLVPEHARLAIGVIDAVERVAFADLVSPGVGTGAAAGAVATAIRITDARRAASLIGAMVDRAAAGDLQSWRARIPGAKPGPGPGPDDLAPALRGLAEAAADPRADAADGDHAGERQ
jgi:hypothetical protein